MKRHTDLTLQYLESPRAKEHAPLVVVLHGRGANAEDLAGLAPAVDPGSRWRMVFPDAPRPFEPYPGMTFGYTWFDGWPPVQETLERSREMLLTFIGELQKKHDPGGVRIALVGFSQGAMMALDVGLRLPEKPAAIVAMSGGIEPAGIPDLTGRLDQKILLIHGTEDDMIPVVYARRTRRALEEQGIEPEYHELAIGHWVTDETMAVVRTFLETALG
jgi:phospholipase/carboxylesterase